MKGAVRVTLVGPTITSQAGSRTNPAWLAAADHSTFYVERLHSPYAEPPNEVSSAIVRSLVLNCPSNTRLAGR